MSRKRQKDINNRKKTTKRRPGGKIIDRQDAVVMLNRDGMGFARIEGYDEDVCIHVGKLRGALHLDKVRVGVYGSRRTGSGRLEGEVLCIRERSKRPHIGTLLVRGNKVWAIVESRNMPYDIRIQVASPDDLPVIGGMPATDGMKVAVMVREWPKGVPEPLGEIVDVLGFPGENDTEMHSILAEYNLPYRFGKDVENAAEGISGTISAKDLDEREDFRAVTTFTIDPSDAKDFDDAISYRTLDDKRVEVGVHIADVTRWVLPGDTIDREAEARGTSVYLVDRTVPMLPEKLCNGLCSLRPHEDKLCFSAVFEIDLKGKVHRSRFVRTVINSDFRLDYEQAQMSIDTGEGPLAAELKVLQAIASALRRDRFKKGAMNFERAELKVIVDKDGKPLDVVKKISSESNFLIEEFMLLANRSVAEFVTKKSKAPFVYRIHDNPDPLKLEELRRFARNFKHELGSTDNPRKTAKSLNSLMESVHDRPESDAIAMMALRAMSRACYSTDNIGHYGLAFEFYCHFTSPIRRYPDIMVHRLLADCLSGGRQQDREALEERCVHASQREQLATEAERASIRYKTVEYMENYVGREFDGHVSGLTEWGIYVEIEPSGIEGMIPVREIRNDFFTFDEKRYRTVSGATGRCYTLGDPIRIRVVNADTAKKMLDFEFAGQ